MKPNWRPWGYRRIRRRWWRPTARCKQEKKPQYVKELDLLVTVTLLEGTPAVLSLEALWRSWENLPLDQWSKTTSHPKWQNNQLQYSELRTIRCPWSVDELLYFIFTCFFNIFIAGYCDQHGKSSNGKKWNYEWRVTVKPVAWIRTNWKHKIRRRRITKWTIARCAECLQNSMENLVDKNVQPHQYSPSSSRELPMEPRAKVVPGPGKHSIKTHFPKDRNCDICLRTKITRASCSRRTGTVVPRAENFGDLITAVHKVLSDIFRAKTKTSQGDWITADHKILSEGCESRHSHRYAVVVQDLATQWLQSNPCKTKTFQETWKSQQKFLEPTRKPKVVYTDNFMEFGKACEELSWNHCTSTPYRSETNGIAERAVRWIKEGTPAVLL